MTELKVLVICASMCVLGRMFISVDSNLEQMHQVFPKLPLFIQLILFSYMAKSVSAFLWLQFWCHKKSL